MQIKDLITPNTCSSTISGWIWYCDSCIAHGTANSSDEAEHMAEAHALYFSWDEDAEWDEEKDPDGVLIREYMNLTPEDRDWNDANWSMECLGAMYLISVQDNKTYQYGEDYSDKTIKPIDLDLAIEIQKKMGLS